VGSDLLYALDTYFRYITTSLMNLGLLIAAGSLAINHVRYYDHNSVLVLVES